MLRCASTNATALRVPSKYRPALGGSRTLEWSVTVRRRSASVLGDVVGQPGEILSPKHLRELRRFTWAPGDDAEPEPAIELESDE